MSTDRIDAARFASEGVLQQWCDRIGAEGFRGTGTAAHERIIAWVEDELAALPGLAVRTDEYEVLRWQPIPEGDLEHAGSLVPVARPDFPGRRLEFTGGVEPLLWAAGPSEVLRSSVAAAVTDRQLERVLVAPGFGAPVEGQVPRIVSFGGLGTYFNVHLIPTTSIITGPWSLWAPAFGADAIDVGRFRQQALAAGDIVAALDRVPRDEIAGEYLADRRARAAGAPTGSEYEPPEVAPG